jgi:hypothetical protein
MEAGFGEESLMGLVLIDYLIFNLTYYCRLATTGRFLVD